MLNISPAQESNTKRDNLTYVFLTLWFAFSFYFLLLKIWQNPSINELPIEYLKSTAAALLFLIGYWKTKSYLIRAFALVYILIMITMNGVLNPLSYATDIFLVAPMITTAFIVLKSRHALFFSFLCILSFLSCVVSAKLYHTEVDSYIVAMSNELAIFILLSFVTTITLLFLYAKIDNSKEDRLEKFVELIRKCNSDNEMLFKVISHDINNALNRSTFSLHKLKSQLGEEDKSIVNLEASITSINEIIENLKRSREIDSPTENTHLSEVHLSSIFKKTEMIFNDDLLHKFISLETSIEDENLKVKTEPVAFVHQILSNLLGNAIKFSKPHSKIYLSATKAEESRIMVKIVNTADAYHLKNLSQSSHSNLTSLIGTKKEKGQGLGLSLVDHYTKALNIKKGLNVTELENNEIQLSYSLNLEGV